MTPINLCFDSTSYQFESESHCYSLEPVISSSKHIFIDHNPIFCGDCQVEFKFRRSLSSQLSYQSIEVESSGSSNSILSQFDFISHLNSKFPACIQSVCCLDSVSVEICNQNSDSPYLICFSPTHTPCHPIS
jgi:hypothetical protein